MTPPAAADPAASAARDPGSFRDPSGFIFWLDGRPYRQIQQRFATEWDAFAGARSKDVWSNGEGSSPTKRRPRARPGPGAHAVIAPEPIEFISYPYEWTFGELRDAALLTLDAELDAIARVAAARRLRLQRPVPRGCPVLIDSLSFEP